METKELLEINELLLAASKKLRSKYDSLTTSEVILFADIVCARSQVLDIICEK